MKAMVLAAGLGTRLKPITFEIPKPMVPVLDRPVMAHIVDLLDRQGFDDLIANLHYFPNSIKNYFGDSLTYRYEEELLGTAGGVRNVARLLRRRPDRGHLGRRAHRHRPAQAASSATSSAGGIAHAHRQEGRRTRASTASSSTTPTGASRASRRSPTRPRRCPTSATAASTSSARRSSTTSPTARSRTGRRTSSRRCSRTTCPFYVHEIDEYWNDVGSLHELKSGTFDALEGKLKLERSGTELDEGLFVGEGTAARGRRRSSARRCGSAATARSASARA